MIICISTLRWMSSRWEMNTKFFRPVIGQIDVRRIERLFVKKKKKEWLVNICWVKSVCSAFGSDFETGKGDKSNLRAFYCRTVWPCLDAHYAFFHRGNHSCACNARCSISQPLTDVHSALVKTLIYFPLFFFFFIFLIERRKLLTLNGLLRI